MSLKTYFGKDGLIKDITDFDDFKTVAGGAASSFFSTVSGKIMTVTAAALALYGAWKLVDNAFNITFEAVQKDLDAATEGFNEAKSELDSVNTELETTVDKIQEFEGKDSLTLVEEIELEKLRDRKSVV